MTNANGSGWVIGAVGLAIGLAVGYLAAPDAPPPNPQERGLDANLWMQTSGEYRACCLQTYRFAAERLRDKLKRTTPEGKPLAVVMDLDETVLDDIPAWTVAAGYPAVPVKKRVLREPGA